MSVSELRDRVEAARKEYQRALETQSEANKFRRGIQEPDGTQLVNHAQQRSKTAFERYTEALKSLNDYVLRRTTLPGAVQVLLIEDNHADARLLEELVAHGPMQVKVAVAQNCARAVRQKSTIGNQRSSLSGFTHLCVIVRTHMLGKLAWDRILSLW